MSYIRGMELTIDEKLVVVKELLDKSKKNANPNYKYHWQGMVCFCELSYQTISENYYKLKNSKDSKKNLKENLRTNLRGNIEENSEYSQHMEELIYEVFIRLELLEVYLKYMLGIYK